MKSTDPIEHPDLADALVRLADALDRRSGETRGLSHLAMAVLADHISQQGEVRHAGPGIPTRRDPGRPYWHAPVVAEMGDLGQGESVRTSNGTAATKHFRGRA